MLELQTHQGALGEVSQCVILILYRTWLSTVPVPLIIQANMPVGLKYWIHNSLN
jgi:hypothetical protein